MNNSVTTLLSYLIQKQIIDEKSATEIKEELKESSHHILGEILLKKKIINKDDLLFLIIDFFKKNHLKLEDINTNFAINNETFLQALAKNLNYKYMDLDSVDIDYRLSSKLPFLQLKKYKALPIRRR